MPGCHRAKPTTTFARRDHFIRSEATFIDIVLLHEIRDHDDSGGQAANDPEWKPVGASFSVEIVSCFSVAGEIVLRRLIPLCTNPERITAAAGYMGAM